MLRSFLIALQFLTSIPINLKSTLEDKEIGNSILFYPVIGLLISLFLILISTLTTISNELITAALILAVWVMITGALHLDGLSDSIDAWFGGLSSRERTLEIMKDPHAGPMGIISLVLILLIKFSAISTLLLNDVFYLLLVPPILARVSALLLLLTTPYVRKEGIGEILATQMPRKKVGIVCLLTILTLLIINPTLILITVGFSLALLLLWRYLLMRRLQGCTGDTLGALIEAIEVLSLVILALI